MMNRPGRNDPCWCGSGKKYKHCHMAFDDRLIAERDLGHEVPDHSLIKTPAQIEKIKESCKINIAVLDYVAEHIRAGVTTEEIDQWVFTETQKRGGRGVAGMTRRDEDVATEMFLSNSHDYNLFFTNLGRVFRIKCYEIPESTRQSKGVHIANILQLNADKDEKVTSMIRIPEFDEDKYLIMVTKHGIIKKTPETEYANIRKNGIIAMTLQEDDELIEVKTTDNTRDIFMVTKYGICIRFKDTDVRSTGRSAMGVRGMNLSEGDEIVGMQLSTQGEALLVVSEKGIGKRTLSKEFPLQRRGGKGVKCYKITEKTGDVVGVKAVNPDHEVMLITNQGIIIQIKCGEISMTGRNASGVKLMRIDADSDITVAGIAKVRDEIKTSDAGTAATDEEAPDLPEAELIDEEERIREEAEDLAEEETKSLPGDLQAMLDAAERDAEEEADSEEEEASDTDDAE